jgi:adenylate cyclase
MNADDVASLGLYDADAPDAADRLALLQYLADLGATSDDLIVHHEQGQLPGLATVLALRGGPGLTLGEVAERSSLDEERVAAFMRAAGFPIPGPTDRVFSESFAALSGLLPVADELFGADVILQLVRVMGADMSRLADAYVSAFLVNIEPPARRREPAGLGIARANVQAVAMIPTAVQVLDLVLRQHLMAARRSMLGDAGEVGYETSSLCVGFVDLVGSTRLAESASLGDPGALLTEFEHLVTDAVIGGGGKVIKLIGDAVLFTAGDPRDGCAIALAITSLLGKHDRLPACRVGLAAGEVMLRDGDVFGPVVNLAARAAGQAAPSEVVLPTWLAHELDTQGSSIGPRPLHGLTDAIDLTRLGAPDGDAHPGGFR